MRLYPSPYAGSAAGGWTDRTAADTVPPQLAGAVARRGAVPLRRTPLPHPSADHNSRKPPSSRRGQPRRAARSRSRSPLTRRPHLCTPPTLPSAF